MKQKTLTIFAGIILIACSARSENCKLLINPDADVVLNISNVSELGKAIKESPFGRLSEDPAIQQTFGKPADNLVGTIYSSIFEQYKKDEEIRIFSDEIRLMTGPFSLSLDLKDIGGKALLQNTKLVAGMSEDSYKHYRQLRNRLADTIDKKIIRYHNKYQGIEIYSESIENEPSSKSWYTWVGNALLLSNSEEWIKKSIVKLKKDPIDDNNKTAPSISVNLKFDTILKTQENSSFTVEGTVIKMLGILEACGLTGLKRINYSLKFNKDNLEVQNLVDFEKPRKGLLSILDPSPSPISLRLPYAPAGVADYHLFRITLLPLWKQLPEIIAGIFPKEQAAQINGMLPGILMGLDIDPEQDILANLGRQWAVVTIDGKPESDSLLLISAKDESGVKNTLDKILGVIAGREKKTFHGTSYYELDNSDGSTTAFTEKAGYFVTGKTETVLQYLLAADSGNTENQAFYKSRDFAALRTHTPNNAFAYSTVDTKKYADLFQSSLEKASIKNQKKQSNKKRDNYDSDDNRDGDDSTPTEQPKLIKKMFPDLNMSNFPTPEHIAEYFGTSFGYSILEDTNIKTINTIKYGDK